MQKRKSILQGACCGNIITTVFHIVSLSYIVTSSNSIPGLKIFKFYCNTNTNTYSHIHYFMPITIIIVKIIIITMFFHSTIFCLLHIYSICPSLTSFPHNVIIITIIVTIIELCFFHTHSYMIFEILFLTKFKVITNNMWFFTCFCRRWVQVR